MPGYYPMRGPALHPIRVIYLIGRGVVSFLAIYAYSLFVIGLFTVTGGLVTLVSIAAGALFSLLKYCLSLIFKPPPSSNKSKTLLGCLMRSFMTEEEEEYISGDLREELSQFNSRREAYVWLSRQILTSILPLLGKNLKARLASYFKEWIR